MEEGAHVVCFYVFIPYDYLPPWLLPVVVIVVVVVFLIIIALWQQIKCLIFELTRIKFYFLYHLRILSISFIKFAFKSFCQQAGGLL